MENWIFVGLCDDLRPYIQGQIDSLEASREEGGGHPL